MLRWIKLLFACELLCVATAAAQDARLSPTDLHATPVTLHLHNSTLAKAVESLNKQADFKIDLNGSGEEPITMDVDKQPFWEVFCKICDQGHVNVGEYWNGTPGIHLMPGDRSATPRAIAGPALVTFQRIERLNQLTAPPAIQDFCDVQAMVIWEPRLAVGFFESISTPTLAVDENGLSLVPDGEVSDPRNSYEQKIQSVNENGMRQYSVQHSIRLKIPATAGRQVAHLSGKIRMWVIDQTQNVEIADIAAANKSHPTLVAGANTKLKIANIWTGDGQVQMQVQFTKNKGESDEDWNLRQRMLNSIKGHLLGSDGKDWGDSNPSGHGTTQDRLDLYLYFQRKDGTKSTAKKLVLEVPVSAVQLDVPYDLHDLPRP